MSIHRLSRSVSALLGLGLVAGLFACGSGTDKAQDGVDSGGKGGWSGSLDAGKLDVAEPSGAAPTGETLLFKMESVQAVSRNPAIPTTFVLSRASYITRVMTYHYGEAIAGKHATVSFQDTATGKTYGPWAQIGYKTFNGTLGTQKEDPGNVVGPPDNYWIAYPGEMVPAGIYQVVDSDPKSWCYTADLGGRGVAFVWGWLGGAPSVGLDAAARPEGPIADVPVVDAALVDVPAVDGGAGIDGQPSGGEAGVVLVGTVSSKLAPATGLVPTDYAVYGSLDDRAGSVAADGMLQATVNQARSGFLFAVPKAGSATAAKLAAGSGMYMTPAPGSSRVCKSGTTWSVASTGTAVWDATTTVMSILLMHPMVANLAPDVQTQQVQWMVATLNAGWTNLANASAAYDRALAAGTDPFGDAAFKAAVTASLGDVLDKMPEYKSSLIPSIDRAPNHVPYSVAKAGHSVTSLQETANGPTSVTLEPGTESGEALDYYYSVKQIAPSAMPQDLASPAFTSPNMLQTLPTVRTVATGFVAASSYWKYVDIAGFALQSATDYLAGATGIKPGGSFELVQKAFYEVRFFSGGFGYGGSTTQYEFVQTNFQADAAAAFRHNVATAVVETLSMIPGADKLLKSEIASKVIVAAVQQTMTELSTMLNAKGAGGISGKDVANLMYNVCKAAADTFAQEAAQASLQKQVESSFTEWFKAGGKATMDFILSVPGNIAKGGSLSNRAFRLARPDSVMEYHIIAVGFSPPAPANYTLRLTLDWGTDGCPEGNSMTVGRYVLVRELPVTVDAAGNFTVKYSGSYGYDTWTIEAAGTYLGGAIKFSSGKWSGDVYQDSGFGPIANDSGTFSTGADGKIVATYSNVMTPEAMAKLGRTKPDTCAGAATVSATMSKL